MSQTRENQDAALDQRFQAWLRERGGIAGCKLEMGDTLVIKEALAKCAIEMAKAGGPVSQEADDLAALARQMLSAFDCVNRLASASSAR